MQGHKAHNHKLCPQLPGASDQASIKVSLHRWIPSTGRDPRVWFSPAQRVKHIAARLLYTLPVLMIIRPLGHLSFSEMHKLLKVHGMCLNDSLLVPDRAARCRRLSRKASGGFTRLASCWRRTALPLSRRGAASALPACPSSRCS